MRLPARSVRKTSSLVENKKKGLLEILAKVEFCPSERREEDSRWPLIYVLLLLNNAEERRGDHTHNNAKLIGENQSVKAYQLSNKTLEIARKMKWLPFQWTSQLFKKSGKTSSCDLRSQNLILTNEKWQIFIGVGNGLFVGWNYRLFNAGKEKWMMKKATSGRFFTTHFLSCTQLDHLSPTSIWGQKKLKNCND